MPYLCAKLPLPALTQPLTQPNHSTPFPTPTPHKPLRIAGTSALSDASLVPALLPLLAHRDPAHLALVASTVRILEAFMDFRWVVPGWRGAWWVGGWMAGC